MSWGVLMAKRPKPIDVGEIRARAVRPRGKSGPKDGRWYWRAEVARRMVWRGWATRTELPLILAEILIEGTAESATQIEDIATVRDLLEVWLGEVVMPRGDTTESTKRAMRVCARRLVRGLGEHRLDRLGRVALDQWVAQRQRQADSALSVRNDLVALRSAWSWGQQVGACPRHDLAMPKVRAVNKRPKRTPTPGELAAIVEHFEGRGFQWMATAVRLQAALGCRIGELGTLTWDQVDLTAGRITLEGKTGRRVLLLRPDLVQLLEELPRDREVVLGRSLRAVHGLNLRLRHACSALGIEPFTTHGIRRLAVDTLARSGIDIGTAAAWLGHSPAVMLEAYRQVSIEDLEGVSRTLGHLPRGEVIPLRPAVAGDASGHNRRSQPADEPDDS
ncbi:MAG: site-specific integrase [Myxococcota bacterium]